MLVKIERFGGNINSTDNSIQLFVAVNLSAEIEGQILSKFMELSISLEETEIYNLIYQLQPLVYQYCIDYLVATSTDNPTLTP